MKTKRKASDKMSKHLLQQWQAVTASLNITLQPQDDIQPWLDAQDEHERQLRLLSQRHELQGQIAAHNQQIIQYQQQIEQRQQQLNGIGGLCTDIATGR